MKAEVLVMSKNHYKGQLKPRFPGANWDTCLK